MTWEGDPHRERQHWRVVCGEWGEDLDVISMDSHIQTQHDSFPLPEPNYYRVVLPQKAMAIDFPVEVFPGRETSRTNLRLYLIHRHVEDIILVLNKDPGPHPRYDQCDMFILQG